MIIPSIICIFGLSEESGPDVSEGMYGIYPLNQSQEKKDLKLAGIQVIIIKNNNIKLKTNY